MPDFYKDVPKTLRDNLEYRLRIRERAANDGAFRKALGQACSVDPLFFFNAFLWLYEPREMVDEDGRRKPKVFPFITWEHQDPVVLEIYENLGLRDIGIEKARGEGASWISVSLALHSWLFKPMSAVGLVSRNEKAADSPDDPDSLMWKIDWQLTKLPDWMSGVKGTDFKRSVTDHSLKNLRNGSTIVAYAATGDVASGGRKSWFLMDELAKFPRGDDAAAMDSTQHVTESRLVVSTPKGSEGAYYELMHEPSNMVRLVLDWKTNPSRNRGMYRFFRRNATAMDPDTNPLLPEYDPPSQDVLDMWSRLESRGFKLEGTVRSPWYDYQCDRSGATPQSIAQELDRDYGGSMYRVFGNGFFEKADDSQRQPIYRGLFDYNPETFAPDFDRSDDGPVRVWTTLNSRNLPPKHDYVIGADISTGVGGAFTSNSVVTVIDATTMTQVMEFACNTMPQSDFAEYCVSVAKWFHDGFLIWEHNGPGTAFTKRVMEIGYPNIYYRKVLFKARQKGRSEPGWFTSRDSKEVMFSELNRSVQNGELSIRSEPLVSECRQYVRINGIIDHVQVASSKDDATKGQAHGDRVIAICVALQGLRDRRLGQTIEANGGEPEAAPGTIAARLKAEKDAARNREEDVWDDGPYQFRPVSGSWEI